MKIYRKSILKIQTNDRPTSKGVLKIQDTKWHLRDTFSRYFSEDTFAYTCTYTVVYLFILHEN